MRTALILTGLLWLTTLPALAADAWQRAPLSIENRMSLQHRAGQLQILDAQGNDVPYGVCPTMVVPARKTLTAPVIPLIRGSELVLQADASIAVATAPGVTLQPPWERWVLDLRDAPQRVLGLQLPEGLSPQDFNLRSSPDLKQWSRPLTITNAGGRKLLLADPIGAHWLALVFTREPEYAPETLEVSLAEGTPARERQWFAVTPSVEGVVSAPLDEVVRGVRVTGNTTGLQAINLASRIKPRDAWKARGGWRPGDGPTQILFNGIGDHQWQLQARPATTDLQWWLAHDRMEIRIPGTPELPLSARIGDSYRHKLACDSSLWTQPAGTVNLPLDSLAPPAPKDAGTPNLLPWFLGLLALVGIGVYAKSRR